MGDHTVNEIFVKNDTIYLLCHGAQDKWVVRDTVARFLELRKDIESTGLAPKCIVDLSDNEGYDTDARNSAIEAMRKEAVPTALVVTNTAMKTVVNFMTKLAGQGENYKAFQTLEEGEVWLRTL